jgi:hypothetical protein
MTTTRTWHTPTPGASYENKQAWLDQRAGGVTATEIRELVKGSSTVRRQLIVDKISGNFVNLDGNRYIDRGNIREPIIAQYLLDSFEIEACDLVYSGENPRHLASPDGLSATFESDRITSEIKTSKHDLTPGKIVDGVLDAIARGSHFDKTGYYDQMQWQMHVMGGLRVLFAWEQHDDDWPDPKPIHDRPLWCWVPRNDERIAQLIEVADRFFVEYDAARIGTIAPVSDSHVDPEIAEHVHALLKYRDDEAVAKKLKEIEWVWLQNKMLPTKTIDDDAKLDLAEATVTVSTTETQGSDVDTVDEIGMRERAPRLVAQYDALRARFTTRTRTPSSSTTKLTITKKKEITE